jgi:hypothetical protein
LAGLEILLKSFTLMLSDDEIEAIVKWRMGRCYASDVHDWRSPDLLPDSEESLGFAKAGGLTINSGNVAIEPIPQRSQYRAESIRRIAELKSDLISLNTASVDSLALFAAMEDARVFSSITPARPDATAVCFQLSHNRLVDPFWRQDTEMILWPYSGRWKWFQQRQEDTLDWNSRQELVFWRGQTTGSCLELDRDSRPHLAGIRTPRPWLKWWLEQHAAGKLDEFDSMFRCYARLAGAERARLTKDIDIKLTPSPGDSRESCYVEFLRRALGADAIADRLDPKEYRSKLRTTKYRIAIEGNDCASSFRDDLLSGSLLLMARPTWENELLYGITENVHYIPLRADFADLEEKLAWCRDNDRLCRDIAGTARVHALKFFCKDVEYSVQARILRYLADQMRR